MRLAGLHLGAGYGWFVVYGALMEQPLMMEGFGFHVSPG